MYVATVLGWLFGRSIPVNINETYDDRIVATFENVLMLKMSFVALLIPFACLSNSYHDGHTVYIFPTPPPTRLLLVHFDCINDTLYIYTLLYTHQVLPAAL